MESHFKCAKEKGLAPIGAPGGLKEMGKLFKKNLVLMNHLSNRLHIYYTWSLGQGLQSLRIKIKLGQKRPHQGALKRAENSTLTDFDQI